MGWNDDEQQNTKKGMSLSSKIVLALIVCLTLIIILIFILLISIQGTSFSIQVDGLDINTTTREALLTTINAETYVNIEEFAKLVEYEYHEGEYKAFVIEKDKCYVQGENETASFYLNNNKVYKLPVNKLENAYEEHTTENIIRSINGKMYAPLEAIEKAFNVMLDETSNHFKIYTLEHLVTVYNKAVKNWGYTGIAEQSFENQKSLLYGYLIVKKENGLYKIIDTDNTKEIVPAKYTSIEFSENMQEFVVTNSSKQVGIINFDGTTKIEPLYETISVLDKETDLYIVQQSKKIRSCKNW